MDAGGGSVFTGTDLPDPAHAVSAECPAVSIRISTALRIKLFSKVMYLPFNCKALRLARGDLPAQPGQRFFLRRYRSLLAHPLTIRTDLHAVAPDRCHQKANGRDWYPVPHFGAARLCRQMISATAPATSNTIGSMDMTRSTRLVPSSNGLNT